MRRTSQPKKRHDALSLNGSSGTIASDFIAPLSTCHQWSSRSLWTVKKLRDGCPVWRGKPNHRVGDVALGQTLERGVRVVAAVEPERLDLLEEIHSVRVVEGRCEHYRVVAVGTVDGDADGDAVA